MVFFVNHAPPASADHGRTREVLSATLTVRDTGGGTLGCNVVVSGASCSTGQGGLTDDSFSSAGYDGQITAIELGAGELDLSFAVALPNRLKQSLTLHVGNAQFALADASEVSADQFLLQTPGLSWSVGDTVELKLTGPYWTGVDLYGGGLVQHSDGALTLDVTKTSGNAFKVRLTQAPTANVTITFSKLATAFGIDDFDAAPETVTFTTSNWQTGKTASILASADAAVGDSIIITAAVSIAGTANTDDPYRSPEQRNGFVVTVKAGGL